MTDYGKFMELPIQTKLAVKNINAGRVMTEDNKPYQTIQRYSGREWGVCTTKQLLEVLGQTVKQDNTNKLIVFLCQLLTYTESDQFNLSFNTPSSSGKSYLALEIASLFPKEDIIDLGYASPASFFHTHSFYDKEKKGYIINLERKILIFLDMPHPQLLERLRPVFSHDQKEIHIKITDKQKFGIKTKDIYIIGHPSVLFCSASFQFDEQELTRFILLSPETTQEKLRAAITEVVKRETDIIAYYRNLLADTKRTELKERIRAIKEAHIKQINLHDPNKLMSLFYERNKILKPRHTRDIKRIACFAKAFALLNLWYRNYQPYNGTIITTDEDYQEAFAIWDQVSMAQDLGLPPYLLNLYKEVIIPMYEAKGRVGITRQEILNKHFEVYGRHLQDFKLRKEYLPMLETSGLVSQEQDEFDKRRLLIYPLVLSTILSEAETVSASIEGSEAK